MRRIQALAMAAAMTALMAFAALPASASHLDGFGSLDGIRSFDDDGIVFLGDRGFDDGRFFDRGLVDGAAPASQEFSERRITSGAANPTFTVTNSGDNSNLCPTGQQVANTGNVANEQGVVLSGSEVDDVDFTGSNITIEPSTTAECTQTLEQAAAV